MPSTNEVAITTDERLAALAGGYDPDLDFRRLALEATYQHAGFTLVSKSALKGVPFIILGVTFREGYPMGDRVGDYVSVEAVTGGPADIKRNLGLGLLEEEPAIGYNELVVFNDGSTGIRRTIAEILHGKSMVNVGPSPEDFEGLKSRFDRPFQYWIMPESGQYAEVTEYSMAFTAESDGEKIKWLFRNGLRASDYQFEVGNKMQDATTWYFA